jgi:hypothetical protein
MMRAEEPRMSEISWLATLAATALAFALGGLWYGPLFGKAWMAEHGFREAALRKDFDPTRTYGLTALLAALSAVVFGTAATTSCASR